jgi:hypothetical protein
MVKKNELMLSFHQSGKNKFDFIAYMPLVSRNSDKGSYNGKEIFRFKNI